VRAGVALTYDAAAVTVDELTHAIAALPLDEARALLAALNVRLAVEKPEPDWRYMAAVYGAPPAPPDNDAYWPHVLVLRAVGPDRVRVISRLRAALGVSLLEAKAAADAAPCELATSPERTPAQGLADVLTAAGATVDVRRAP